MVGLFFGLFYAKSIIKHKNNEAKMLRSDTLDCFWNNNWRKISYGSFTILVFTLITYH